MLDSGSSRDTIDACVQRGLCLISSRIPEFSLALANNTQIMYNSIVSVTLAVEIETTFWIRDTLCLTEFW